MNDRLSQTLVELCRIPSPSRQEGGVAAYIRQRVGELGFSVEEDEAGKALGSDTGNLVVRTKGRGEPLFLVAHMDTVPPTTVKGEVPVVVEGDRVHTDSRSILGADDKAGIALALEMLHNVAQDPAAMRPLDVIFTIQEELGVLGASHIDPAGVRARKGFVLDGDTPVATAIHQSPSKARFHISVTGRAAHAAVNPEDGINAIKAIGAIVANLPTGKLSDTSTANLGRIEGGGTINVVPDQARLVGEVRSLLAEEMHDLRQRIERIAREKGGGAGAQVALEWEPLYDGYAVPLNDPITELFVAACARAGMEARFHSTYGGGDANQFNSKGLACIVFGLGMQRIHTPDEFILLTDLIQAAQILSYACRAD